MQGSITINEWLPSEVVSLSKEEIDFLNYKINEGKPNSKIEIIAMGDNQYQLKATSWIGTVKLPSDYSITIRPKVGNLNFFKMLAFSEDFDSDEIRFFDVVYASEGQELIDFMAKLYAESVLPIMEEGIYKSYVPIIEEIPSVKGRLLLAENIRHPRLTHEKFWCEHDELTNNVLENQILLYCANLLSLHTKNRPIKEELDYIQHGFESQGVSLEFLESHHLDMITYQKHNEHYEQALKICEFILKITWYNDFTQEENLPIHGFLYDMNVLYQKFVTKLLQKILEDHRVYAEPKNDEMLVRIPDELGGAKKVTLKPDIMIKDKKTKNTVLIIDTKYKKEVSSNDIYQSLAYSITFDCPTVLLVPKFEELISDGFRLNPNLGKEKEAEIYIRTVDFSDKKDFLNEIKDNLKEIILPWLK